MTASRERGEAVREYYWEEYCVFARQRAEIFDDIKESLSIVTQSIEISQWQRIISFQYALHPLSSVGSIKNQAGGRFNYGQIDPARFPPFPALYIAEDKPTAMLEVFGPDPGSDTELNRMELALLKPDSQLSICLSGTLDVVLDITIKRNLEPFIDLISNFKIPENLKKMARKLKFDEPNAIHSIQSLIQNMMKSEWKGHANLCGVPATPQIFGQIACLAGIEAIKYRSIHKKKNCIAIFPENFENSSSYVEIDGPLPEEKPDIINRLDKDTWKKLV